MRSYNDGSRKQSTQYYETGYDIDELLNDLGVDLDETEMNNQVKDVNDNNNQFIKKPFTFLKKVRDDLQSFYQKLKNYKQ